MKRCYKPENFGSILKVEFGHCSDASEDGYGQCSCLRIIVQFWTMHCSLLTGKCRVSPIKFLSILRLELTTDTLLSVNMSKLIRNDLEIGLSEVTFCTNSMVVLRYIKNKVNQSIISVADRVEIIDENSNVNQWNYMSTKLNPTYNGSKRLDGTNVKKFTCWLKGGRIPVAAKGRMGSQHWFWSTWQWWSWILPSTDS